MQVYQSYLNPPLTTAVSTTSIGGWFSRTGKRVNPRALPQEAVNAILDDWKVQIEHQKQERVKLEKEKRDKDRKQVCVTSAAVGIQGESLEANTEETVISVEPHDETVGFSARKLC